MKYKLVALDVDGTLLNDDHQVTEETKRTLLEVNAQGGRIVLCTGRGPLNTFPVLSSIGLDGTAITHNGAATVSPNDKAVLHEYSFTVDSLQPFIEYCRKYEVHMDACTAFEMYIEGWNEEDKQMYEKYMIRPLLIDNLMILTQPLVKFTVFGTMEVMDRVENDWKDLGGTLRIIRSGDYFIDVMRADASKGSALKELSRLWGIKPNEVIAFGNYYNDIEMLEFAGLGIAMDNSPEEVKKRADTVTSSNNKNGVHQALRRYFFGENSYE